MCRTVSNGVLIQHTQLSQNIVTRLSHRPESLSRIVEPVEAGMMVKYYSENRENDRTGDSGLDGGLFTGNAEVHVTLALSIHCDSLGLVVALLYGNRTACTTAQFVGHA